MPADRARGDMMKWDGGDESRIATLEAEVKRLRAERDESDRQWRYELEGYKAAHAEIERLREAREEDGWSINQLTVEVEQLRVRTAGLQRAVDEAHSAMAASEYVGGPSEREAWQTAVRALGTVATQYQGAPELTAREETR